MAVVVAAAVVTGCSAVCGLWGRALRLAAAPAADARRFPAAACGTQTDPMCHPRCRYHRPAPGTRGEEVKSQEWTHQKSFGVTDDAGGEAPGIGAAAAAGAMVMNALEVRSSLVVDQSLRCITLKPCLPAYLESAPESYMEIRRDRRKASLTWDRACSRIWWSTVSRQFSRPQPTLNLPKVSLSHHHRLSWYVARMELDGAAVQLRVVGRGRCSFGKTKSSGS